MFSVTLCYLGNEKDSYYNEAAAEYVKRLGAYCKYNSVNLKDERLPENPSNAEIKAALDKEAVRILDACPQRDYRIALCVEGKQMSSEELSALLGGLPQKGYSGASFIIGSSYGLSDTVKSACDLRLSVSKMTFPHKLFRVMLLEQIYRAFTISAGTRYHK